MVFFFCKPKTAYELRISDWSSDVRSSDPDSVRILATVSVGALAMATVPAMAQDATAAPQQPAASQTKYDGDAIVVTGITKQDANIQDTPIAITAFSGETLTEQGIGKVDEIATFTPGFNKIGRAHV